jgi:hypothetical protein
MVECNDLLVIDLLFLLKSSEQSFWGAPLILGPQGEDNTVLYGVARDLLRLRKNVGIEHAIIIIGREAISVSSEATVSRIVGFLNRLGAIVIYEPHAAAVSLFW